MRNTKKRTVLVSGVSIAGPALAYWLHRFGFEVTLVERARELRGGGYPIDIRGTALGVIERMGLSAAIRAEHVDTRRLTFVDVAGEVVGEIRPEAVTGGVAGRDIELPRGQLARILYSAVRDDLETLFDDSIAALRDSDAGCDVTFRSGRRRTFDLVIGADGLHSNTRQLLLGPEAQFQRYLGFCFAGFSMPNDLGLAHEGVTWNVPGKAATLVRTGRQLAVARDPGVPADAAASNHLRQPRRAAWLLCREFLGRWLRSDHREAFAAYACVVREIVRRNQALADDGALAHHAAYSEELAGRNRVSLRDPARR
jgi:2-polyprenyl-6-methoxyphenol hydroxylase-like FAD-dependent oxidoreductase